MVPARALAMTMERAVRVQGRVSEWRDDRGFGFVTPDQGGSRVFLHVKAFRRASRRPQKGDVVSYLASVDGKGRVRAEAAELVSAAAGIPPRAGIATAPAYLAGLFLLVVAALVAAGKSPIVLLYLYAGLSLLTFGIYAADKAAAVSKQGRVEERTLQLLAVLGGWPGAVFAQRWLRHKSRKRSFQRVFWGAVVINVAGYAWLLTADGARVLARVLAG